MASYTPYNNYNPYQKPKKKGGCLLPILIVVGIIVAISIVGIALNDLAFSRNSAVGKLSSNLERLNYRYKDGSYTSMNEKLQELVAQGDFAEAAIYIEENDWYTITDKATAEVILTAIKEGKLNNRNTNMTSSTDRENADKVLSKLDCPDARNLVQTLDAFYWDYGTLLIENDKAKAYELLQKCSHDSPGNALLRCYQKLDENDILGAAQIIREHTGMNQDQKLEVYQILHTYRLNAEISDPETYFIYEKAMAMAYPYHTLKPLTTEDGYTVHQMINDPMSEAVRSAFPGAFTANNAGDILILNKVTDYQTDETSLAINWIMTQRLPEERQPETLTDVGYVIVLDYGYIHDGKWYAGTATAIVYEVATGEILYTSDTVNAQYKDFYYGPPTEYIFSSYPDATSVLVAALDFIENN